MASDRTFSPTGVSSQTDIDTGNRVDRFRLALERQGLVDLATVRALSDSDLLALRGVGPHGLAELRRRDYLISDPAPGQPTTFVDALHHSLVHLTERERLVVERLYGLDGQPAEAATTLGKRLDRSAGRIRVLRDQALRRLTSPALWPEILPALSRVVFVRTSDHSGSVEWSPDQIASIIGSLEVTAALHLIDDLLRVRAPIDGPIGR